MNWFHMCHNYGCGLAAQHIIYTIFTATIVDTYPHNIGWLIAENALKKPTIVGWGLLDLHLGLKVYAMIGPRATCCYYCMVHRLIFTLGLL